MSQHKMRNLVVKCTPLFRQFTYEILYLCALYKFIEELHGITDAERCRIDMTTSLPKQRAEKNTTENESHNTI